MTCHSKHLNLYRHILPSPLLLARKVVQALEPNYATASVFHEYNVISDFFADVFLSGVVKPNGERVADAVMVNSHFVHKACPFLMFLVK